MCRSHPPLLRVAPPLAHSRSSASHTSAFCASASGAFDIANEAEGGEGGSPPPALPPPPNAFSAMLPAAAKAGPAVSITGAKAHTFYDETMGLCRRW